MGKSETELYRKGDAGGMLGRDNFSYWNSDISWISALNMIAEKKG